ncbi:hypothetical protein C7974DRAFT_25537 [Boeremia exigua]|uniref:uncharacterized protein n=1 Tax=Boeremia exigua TaxID=749465 RepID=UPI001E8E6C03|nr:uncharacterized protein C7974DRAFT_25537 [Boeremia exigua]KAH6644655.1 hypothetical protein C7974DRAFT_25537 [Boeremia exigua]
MAENQRRSQRFPYSTNKRARQACENCRRKKSKCTGERPDCSCCVRLRQKCVYAAHHRTRERSTEPHNDTSGAPQAVGTDNSERLNAIEDMLKNLAAVIDVQRHSAPAKSPTHQGQDDEHQTARFSQEPVIQLSPISLPTVPHSLYPGIQDAQLPDTVIAEGIALYFSNFCNQPCPILANSQSLEPGESDPIAPMILYAMLALSLRSSRHPFFKDTSVRTRCIANLTQLAWNLITMAYCEFEIDDVYFQALCLQAQVDSGDGKLERARAQVAIGLRVAQARDMLRVDSLDGLELADRARRQEIIWSLFMLDRMLLGGNTKNPSTPTAVFELPVIQSGPCHPDGSPQTAESDVSLESVDSDIPLPPQSVACLQIQTIRIWECIIDYIAQPPLSTDIPLWRHDSPRAAILTKLLDIETRCETAGHTLTCVGSPARVLEEPRLTSYFVIWLRFHMTLSAVNCILNHPFIIHVKTARLKHKIPLTFLQKSYEFSLIHANWVFRLLNHMNEAELMLHDPFLGHLVAIAASVHLEHTRSQYPTVAASAKQKFDKCFDFVKRLSMEWPRMQIAVSLLEQLEARIPYRSNLNYVEEEYDGAAPPDANNQVYLAEEDLLLMWKLFEYASTSTKPNSGYAFDAEPDYVMRSVRPDLRESSTLTDGQESGHPSPNTAAGMTVHSRLDDIAVRSYGDTPLSGGSTFNYFLLNHEPDHLHYYSH